MRRPVLLVTTLLCALLATFIAPAHEAPAHLYVEPPPPPPRPPQLVKAQTFAEPGRIEKLTIDSAALGSRRQVNLYLPPGYDRGDAHYPVVYLLRGHEYEWLDNTSSESRKGRNAALIADGLIMAGAMPPVILVLPPMASANKEIIALGVNLPNPRLARGAPGVGPGRFEDFVVREVIPAVDREFRTIADRRYRGIDGFSLGGFTSISLAMRHPELFASAGAYEGSFVYPGGRRPDGQPDEYLNEEMKDTFGSPPDLALLQRVSPMDLAESLPAEDLERIAFHIQSAPVGRGDQDRAALLVRRLGARGIGNSFQPMEMPDAKHGWYWADDHLLQVLPRHAAVFERAER
ncbi:MAG TPA: alpha/beta hydrolase-fold protein [Symbiobacteriaceae bacterium]|nr:alpha/beta hydrolase-fold protein [Symbiobacteriaceae bacterium]